MQSLMLTINQSDIDHFAKNFNNLIAARWNLLLLIVFLGNNFQPIKKIWLRYHLDFAILRVERHS